MNRLFLVLAAFVCQMLCGQAMAQMQISQYMPGRTPEGAVYFLPKTALRITLLVEKTTYQPGDFATYAQRYLRLANVGTEPATSHRIIEMRQTAIGVADSSKRYALKFNPAMVKADVVLADDGCLLAINDTVVKELPQPPFRPARREEPANPRLFMSEEILAAGSTAKMAQLTAQEIFDIRENRSLLAKGQADFMPKDGEQLRLMLNQLELQDRALTSMFQGVTRRDTIEHVITYIPETPVRHQLLFRLSQQLGLVDTDDLSGAPYYIDIEDVSILPQAEENTTKKPVKKKLYEDGVYVNVPGRMKATIYEGIKPLQAMEHSAPQFGNVELFASKVFNKHYTTQLLLSPVSGGILHFK